MIFWIIGLGLVGVACREITWRDLGDMITLAAMLALGTTLFVLVNTSGSSLSKLFGLGVFLTVAYLAA